jgi:RNA polymerase sigma-70 factor (ECF subfamily)
MDIEKTKLCDKIVFEGVYKLYSKDLYRFLTFSFKNSVLAEDITQNVFLKLWDECHKFNMVNIKSLIYTMGKNLSINQLKKDKKKETLKDTFLSFAESPQELLEEKQFKEKLIHAIDQLSDKEREVFLMNRIEDLPYREIAVRLEISQKAVEKRMHQALKKLNELLSINLKRKQ